MDAHFHTRFVKTTNPCKSNKADSTDGDYLKTLYPGSKKFTYKYSNYGKYDGINKKETEVKDLVVGHLEYFKDGDIHVGNAYIKLTDIETPLKPISASTDGVNLTVVPAMDGDPAETKTGASLINGYNALAKVCLLKTTEKLPLEDGTLLPIGTSYQWVHPGGWVYKTEGGKYYYTGLTVDGWGATDEELKKSAVDIKNDPSSSASLSLKGGKRRRKTKRKRTKRRKTKRKRSRRKRTMKRKKRRGKKRRGKTRRRR